MSVQGTPLPPPDWRPAEPALLRDAVERAGGAGEPPGASLTEYLFDLGRWVQSQLVALLGRALPDAGYETLELVVIYGAVVVAVAALAVVVVMVARRMRARSGAGGASPTEERTSAGPAAARDAEWWWGEAARRLESGEVRAALGALWWWAARRLDPPGLEESWTTGELLRSRGASALRPSLRRLDALLWGADAPRAEQVEELRWELRRRVEAAGAAP